MSVSKVEKPVQVLVKQYSATYNITANGATTVSLSSLKDEDNQQFAPISGYTQAGIVRLTSGNADVLIRGYDIWSSSGGVYFVNVSNSAKSSLTASIYILWLKTS